jgi:hypothetical protein
MSFQKRLSIRWTIGDVAVNGYESLRLSIWGTYRLFGDDADYVVRVASISLPVAQLRIGKVPAPVRFRAITADDVPSFIRAQMSEQVAWRFAAPCDDIENHRLDVDNDCILWSLPPSMAEWLADDSSALIAADSVGIRGLPPGRNLGVLLADVMHQMPASPQRLQSEALARAGQIRTVGNDEVTVCSPFPPHKPWLGKDGAHFVGLNIASYGTGGHFESHRSELYARVGLESR